MSASENLQTGVSGDVPSSKVSGESKRKPNSPLSPQRFKKAKTYAQVTKNSTKICIKNFADNGEFLKEPEYKIILRLLLKKLDMAEKPCPSFESHGFNIEMGVFWLVCSDTHSVEWVLATFPEVANNPLLDGLIVRALKTDANYVRFSIVFPYDEAEPESVSQVLARLRRANDGLDTSYWVPIAISKPSNLKGWFFLLGIDDSSVTFLKNHDFRLHYAFGRVFFREQTPRREKAVALVTEN